MALGIFSYSGVCYHDDIDLDAPVYKFYPLRRFLEAVENSQIYFRNILKWKDNWERPTKFFNSRGLDERSALFLNRDKWIPTFATCFTSYFDTDALWCIYSPDRNSVCIETTAKALLKEMEKLSKTGIAFYYAPVIYIDADQSSPIAIFDQKKAEEYPAQFYTSFIKRNAFSYEQEIRLAVQYIFGGNTTLEGIKASADMHEIVKKVILDPRLTKEEVSYHKTCLEKLGFWVEQSSLFSDAKFNGMDYSEWIKKMEHSTISGSKSKFFQTQEPTL